MGGRRRAWRVRFRPRGCFLCLVLTVPCLLYQEAAGQVERSYAGETSMVDGFGNAKARYPHTRQRGGATGGQRQTRRPRSLVPQEGINRDGVLSALSQPNEVYRMMQARRSKYPFVGGQASAAMLGNYATYGGFAKRPVDSQAGGAQTAFRRRLALIGATAMNAPVHRARMLRGLEHMGLPTAVGVTAPSPTEPVERSAGFERLGERLKKAVLQSHAQARTEGWKWFRKGDEDARYYRRSAHAFKAAVTLDPLDFESRIGEVFSHLSLGAFRTSVVLFGKLARRDSALFSHPLDFAEIYADRVRARQVSMQAETYARGRGGDAGAMAFPVFVLWYCGQREQAMLLAETLAGVGGGEHFGDWIAQMREAGKTSDMGGESP